MAQLTLTDEQQQAITAQGKIVVSASAGSGKTFVMINRIVNLILSEQASVETILAVTFTKKAASQMQDKLRSQLIKNIVSCEDVQKKEYLKTQLKLIPTSKLCTLHKLCNELLRTYFYEANIDADFEVLEDADKNEFMQKAMDDLFEESYETADEKFEILLKIFASSKKDKPLRDIVLNIFEKANGKSDPVNYLQELKTKQNKLTFDTLILTVMKYRRQRIKSFLETLNDLKNEISSLVQSKILKPSFEAYVDLLLSVCKCFSESDTIEKQNAFASVDLGRKPPLNKEAKEDYFAISLDARLSQIKKEIKEYLGSLYAFESYNIEYEKYSKSSEIAGYLIDLSIKFADKFSLLKLQNNKLDFSDLEHLTMILLQNEKVKSELHHRYKYLFIDEYQDINPTQESILNSLTQNDVFMVGDAKQSIYGFRGCDSSAFLEKEKKFSVSENCHALKLTSNFRSGKAIIDTVNRIFCECMTEETSSLNYERDSKMTGGIKYGEHLGRAILDFYGEDNTPSDDSSKSVYSVKENFKKSKVKINREALKIAGIINDALQRKYFNIETGKEEFYSYKDIAILTRNNTNHAKNLVQELVKLNISASSSAKINICDYAEIQLIISILKLIDNFKQDESLIAVLKGVADISDNDLAEIRLNYKAENYFYDCVNKYSTEKDDEISEKINDFLTLYNNLKLSSEVMGAGEIINKILSETELEAFILSKPNGKTRVKHLKRFILETFVNDRELKIKEFLTRLKNLDYKINLTENGGEDIVKILTMHASKGLEYPLVIVAGLDNNFSNQDVRDRVFLDDEYGVACKYYNLQNYTTSETLLRNFLKTKSIKKRTAEELNLFYVACTRAMYELRLVFEKPLEFEKYKMIEASKFSEFVNFNKFKKYDENFDVLQNTFTKREILFDKPTQDVDLIVNSYKKEYDFKASESLPVKSTATKINELNAEKLEKIEQSLNLDYTVFVDDETDKAKEGTAYHAYLQLADLTKNSIEEINVELKKIQPQIDGELFNYLNAEKIYNILSLSVFKELIGYNLYREQPFLVKIPANQIQSLNTPSDDEILLQGFIDLLAVKEDNAVIIDYKYSDIKDKKLLLEKYKAQLDLYYKAVKIILKDKTVSAKIVNIKNMYEIVVK